MLKTALLILVVLQSTIAIAHSVARPVEAKATSNFARVEGTATWYRYRQGQAAAGPALRFALGKHWRGSRVLVCEEHGRCVAVRLTDWCACSDDRVIDLDLRDFGRLANPRLGVLAVTVVGLPRHLPQTDTGR